MNPAYRFCIPAIVMLSFAIAHSQEAMAPVCPRDAASFAAVRKKVEAHDPTAETALASCYDLGQHVNPDGKEAIRWLTEAAGQGYAPAEYELGRTYLYGRGVPADYARALLWERKAAEQGDARAQRDLAFMYERGFGVPVDTAQAAEWNRKAAAQGHAEAQLQLARSLNEGTGVSKDPEEARKWYARAARQDQPAAQLELARESAGRKNCPAAIHWYEKAAEHSQTEAMYELGRLYLSGQCGTKEQALTWFTIGTRFGSAQSREEAGKLAAVLPPAQKKRAKKVAENWIKEHPGSDKEEDEEEKK